MNKKGTILEQKKVLSVNKKGTIREQKRYYPRQKKSIIRELYQPPLYLACAGRQLTSRIPLWSRRMPMTAIMPRYAAREPFHRLRFISSTALAWS